MNDILLLKGHFEQKAHPSGFGQRNIPKSKWVRLDHIQSLQTDLQKVKNFWAADTLLNDKIVTAYYSKIVAKSNRLQGIFSSKSDSIIGVKFSDTKPTKHIITHCIRFILSGIAEKFDTYNFAIPVPVSKEQHPFAARATICYFPNCSRNQGVDYTGTELDVHFGKINNSDKIKPIDNNMQSETGQFFITEEDARSDYRKWDNVKIIRETITGRPKKKYRNGLWGISIKSKQRLNKPVRDKVNFGIIITLKEINGVNRLEDFIQACSLKGWLVHRINVENRIDLYNKAEAEIRFEE